jgi:hypothetical protein
MAHDIDSCLLYTMWKSIKADGILWKSNSETELVCPASNTYKRYENYNILVVKLL